MKLITYAVDITMMEDLLASNPADPGVYAEYIASKRREEAEAVKLARTSFRQAQTAEANSSADTGDGSIAVVEHSEETELAEELGTLSADKMETSGWSVFHKDEKGIFLYEYHIKGFLKEAATSITGKDITAVKSKIDRWLFIAPRRLYLLRDGKPITKADGVLERPIRAMTMQGPRTCLKRSDMIRLGAQLSFQIKIVDHGASSGDAKASATKKNATGNSTFTQDVLSSWLEYGSLQGLGEWRNGGYGRFSFDIKPV